MRLVYWGLAIGGFVLVVTWLWGALVAFSLILLLIIGYEIWRQSRPLALSNPPRKTNSEDDLVERSLTEAPLPDAPLPNAPLPNAPLPNAPLPNAPLPNAPLPNAAVKPTAKPAGKFRFRLVDEKLVKQSSQSDFDQPHAIPAQSAGGGDRTVIQEPLTLISDAQSDANTEIIQDSAQPDSDLANAPTVIESLDQIHFAESAEANPHEANWIEEPTVQPTGVSKQAIAKPSRQTNPWDEPVTTPRILNPQSNQTIIRPSSATGEPTVAKPFQSHSADEPTLARPFQPPSSADEKTVIGPLKAKASNKPPVASPFSKHDFNNVTEPKPADGESNDLPTANLKVSPLQSTDPEKPTVIGQSQSPNPKEQTTL